MRTIKLIVAALLLSLILQFNSLVLASELTPSGVAIDDIESIVDGIMEDEIGVTVPGSAIVVVKDGEIVFSKGYGLAVVEDGVEVNSSTTVFEIGSISKTFTWTAIMQLVDQGKIALEDDIREYIGYDRLELKFEKPITIKDLMNHSAGFEENASEMMTFKKENLIPLDVWVSKEHQPAQVYEPGSTVAYSNFSTDIAGLIVEIVSGEKFEEYISNHIFIPLGMNSSTAYANYDSFEIVKANKASGYGYVDGEFQLMPENFLNEAPAGSIKSTVEDMGRFMIGLLGESAQGGSSLYSNREFALSTYGNTLEVDGDMPSIAHGFWAREEGGVRILEHGGNTTNFSAFMSIVPNENFGICVLTNLASENSGVRTEVVNELTAKFNHNAVPIEVSENRMDLSGNYSSARMIHSNFLSSIYLMSGDSIAVKDLNNGYVDVSFEVEPTASYRYAEIAPYIYERTDSELSYFDRGGGSISHLKFILSDDGKVESIRTGNIRDYISLPIHKSFALNKAIFILVLSTYLIGIVYMIISKLNRKKYSEEIVNAQRMSKQIRTINILGVINIINIVATVIRFMIQMTSPIGNFKIHLILNCILGIVMIINSIEIVRELIFKKLKSRDRAYGLMMVIATVLLLLWELNYNYFNFWTL